MPKDAEKLLENVSLGLAAAVADKRLEKAGVVVDLKGRETGKAKPTTKLPPDLIKRLAGV
jgi:hypothetical protein